MEPESSIHHTKIKPTDVYNVLETRKFIDKLLNAMLHDIKKSPAYIDLKEIATHHFTSVESSINDEPIEKKKKQSYDVGYLSDCIASTLTKTVQDKLVAFQDDIYAASKSVIEELEMKNSDNREIKNQASSLPKENGSPIIYTSTPNKRNKKRCIETNSDTNGSPLKRLPNKPKSKDYSTNISPSVTNYCFVDAANESDIEKTVKLIKKEEILS